MDCAGFENPREIILIMMIAVNVEAVGKAGMGGRWLQDRTQNGEPGGGTQPGSTWKTWDFLPPNRTFD